VRDGARATAPDNFVRHSSVNPAPRFRIPVPQEPRRCGHGVLPSRTGLFTLMKAKGSSRGTNPLRRPSRFQGKDRLLNLTYFAHDFAGDFMPASRLGAAHPPGFKVQRCVGRRRITRDVFPADVERSKTHALFPPGSTSAPRAVNSRTGCICSPGDFRDLRWVAKRELHTCFLHVRATGLRRLSHFQYLVPFHHPGDTMAVVPCMVRSRMSCRSSTPDRETRSLEAEAGPAGFGSDTSLPFRVGVGVAHEKGLFEQCEGVPRYVCFPQWPRQRRCVLVRAINSSATKT